MATLTHEYYPKTGEFVVHVEDGVCVRSAISDDGVKYSLIKSESAGFMWIEANGRSGLSVVAPRVEITNDWFMRWINGEVR